MGSFLTWGHEARHFLKVSDIMVVRRSAAFLLGSLAISLASCSGGGGGGSSTSSMVPNPSVSSSVTPISVGPSNPTGGSPSPKATSSPPMAVPTSIGSPSSPTSTPTPAGNSTSGTIAVTPNSLSFINTSSTMDFSANEAGYSQAFAAHSMDPTIADVKSKDATTFTVTPFKSGNTSIIVSDSQGKTATVTVYVTTTTVIIR